MVSWLKNNHKTMFHIGPTLESPEIFLWSLMYMKWYIIRDDNKLPVPSGPSVFTAWNERSYLRLVYLNTSIILVSVSYKQTYKHPSEQTNKQTLHHVYKTANIPHDLHLGRGRPHRVPSVSPMDG